jgi:hypothetical protein
VTEFKASAFARFAGFAVFLSGFALALLAGAALLALAWPWVAIGVMFVGGGAASFLGIATTGWLSRRELQAWRQRQSEQPFVIREP